MRMGGPLSGRVEIRSSPIRFGSDWASVVGACVVAALALIALLQPSLTPAAATTAVLVPAAVVDVRERRLPDRWVLAAAVVLTVGSVVERAAGGGPDAGGLVAGGAVMSGLLLGLHLLSPDSMGFGDVKVAVVLGAAIGSFDWRLAMPALLLAAATGVVVGIVRRSSTIAFGPCLVAGTVAVLALAAVDPGAAGAMS
jgi:leader peptidase (prepilin peptidase)/N-methyltransferase